MKWDQALAELFGLPDADTITTLQQFLACVHLEDRARIVRACESCRTEGTDFDQEFRVVLPDSSLRWLYDRGKTFRDTHGQPAYVTGACVDITPRRLAEEALRDAHRQKDQFLATLAHELRNPLTPLKHALALLVRKLPDDEAIQRAGAHHGTPAAPSGPAG